MVRRAKKQMSESPITFISGGHQIVGMLHSSGREKIVILCHGFTGNKCENRRLFVEAAREIARQGYDALRFDFYGSGDSAGEFCDTLVSHNIQNVKDAVAWCKERGYEQWALLGLSMGGATAILCANEVEASALVIWSAVPDMKLLFEHYVDDLQNKVQHVEIYEHDGWLIKRAFWEDAIGYDIAGALGRIRIPKMIVQGTEDSPLFVRGFQEFQKIVYPPADFMEIPGGGHTFQKPSHRRQVIRQTTIWLKRHF
jgi:pimeloyl-ACP methyl ester carboxylesterase